MLVDNAPAEQSRKVAAEQAAAARESGRSTSRRFALLVLVLCLLIWFWRRPEQLFHPYIWAEESHVLRRFLDDGWLGALHPVEGYMILPATFLLPLAATLSLSHFTAIAFWFATAVFALTVLLLVLPDSRWGSQRTRALMALAMALFPANPETVGVLLYSFWWASLWPVIILGWRQALWWVRLPLLAVGALSSPAGALMVVVFGLSWIRSRRRVDLLGTAVLAIGLAIQALCLSSSSRGGNISAELKIGSIFEQSLRTGGLFVTWWTAPGDQDWRFVVFVGFMLFGALGSAAVYACVRLRTFEPALLVIATVIATGLSAVPAPLITDPQFAGPRYYFLPYVLLGWLLIHVWRESGLPAPVPVIACILVGVSLVSLSSTFSRPVESSTGWLDWHDQIVECAASDEAIVSFPVYLDGSKERLWEIGLTPAQCRGN